MVELDSVRSRVAVDLVVARVEAGESVRRCCDRPGAPTRNEFRRAIRKNPALRARYGAAIARWSAPHARSREHFDAIEQRIRAGEILAEIFATDDPSFPDPSSFRRFLKSSPAHVERYRAAFRSREAGANARGAAPKFTDAELHQAAAALAATTTRYVSQARVAPAAPHARTLMEARRRNGDLCAVIESAMITRISRLKIIAGPMFKPLTRGLVLPQRRTVRRIYERHVLKRALSQNEIYAAVDAAVPKYFSASDRDDIVAQTALEVIEDGLGLDMVAVVVSEVIADHYKQARSGSGRTESLDARMFSDSTVTRGDLVTNGWL